MASRSSADKLKPLPPDPDRHQHSAIPPAHPRCPTDHDHGLCRVWPCTILKVRAHRNGPRQAYAQQGFMEAGWACRKVFGVYPALSLRAAYAPPNRRWPMILSAIAEKLKRRSKDDFKGRHFEAALILQAVSW